MLSGYNNEIRYKGVIYHVQTEDGGKDNPQVTTCIFLKGSIVARVKESYEALLSVSNLNEVVRKMMQEQHKDIIRRLIRGEFSEQIEKILNHSGSGAVPPPPDMVVIKPEHAVVDLGGDPNDHKPLDELILEAVRRFSEEEQQ